MKKKAKSTETYQVEKLSDIDQREIKRGLCPWCLVRLIDDGKADICQECGDSFIGVLTIDD